MKVTIHSCDKRRWYVDEFLIPSLTDQGIIPNVVNDDEHKGCLMAYVSSFWKIKPTDDGTWHLQDDVMISKDFAKVAREHDEGIVYGFFHRHASERDFKPGRVSVMEAGYSFPCVRIPDRLASEFAEWFLSDAQFRDKYQRYIEEKKYADVFWRDFLREKYPDEYVLCLKPSIVEHVDEYIGGSTINYWRDGWCHAEYFDDTESLEKLRVKLTERKTPSF